MAAFVILKWDGDAPGVYLGHRLSWWRAICGLPRKACFARIDMRDAAAFRFQSHEGAAFYMEGHPDLMAAKELITIWEIY